MRSAWFGFAALLWTTVEADSFSDNLTAWADRANELGITSARVVFDYSVTDTCEVGPARLSSSTSKDVFDSDGSLASATFTDGRFPPSQSVKDRPISVRLSTLGTKTRTVRFFFRDGTATWDDQDA